MDQFSMDEVLEFLGSIQYQIIDADDRIYNNNSIVVLEGSKQHDLACALEKHEYITYGGIASKTRVKSLKLDQNLVGKYHSFYFGRGSKGNDILKSFGITPKVIRK